MKYYENLTKIVFAEDVPQISDVIFIPGSRYGELAVRAAELYQAGIAKLVVPSGKYSTLKGVFEGPLSPEAYVGRTYETESDFFAAVLMENGVEREVIIKEDNASFTYENAVFSRHLLEQRGIYQEGKPFKAVIVCQAFHARRCLMYYQYVFPGVEFFVVPVNTQGIHRDNWYQSPEKIDVVLGEVKRLGVQFEEILKGTDRIWKKEGEQNE